MRANFFIMSATCLAVINANAQRISEVQYKDDKWFVEMTNKEGTPVSSVKIEISVYEKYDTIIVAGQGLVDSLNSAGAVVIDTLDIPDIISDFNTGLTHVVVTVNDTITSSLGWYNDCACLPLYGYSISFLDSLDIYGDDYGDGVQAVSNNDYEGISKPSLGKANLRDSSFAIIKGKLLKPDGSPYANTSFVMGSLWDYKTGDVLITSDSAGNVLVAAWPVISNATCLCGESSTASGIMVRDSTRYRVIVSLDPLYPGINYMDLKDCGITKAGEVKENSLLQVSPNPAIASITATYELPAGEDYRRCQLRVSNAAGRPVRTVRLQAAGGKQSIPLGGLPGGVYYCSLVGSQAVLATGRFVVE